MLKAALDKLHKREADVNTLREAVLDQRAVEAAVAQNRYIAPSIFELVSQTSWQFRFWGLEFGGMYTPASQIFSKHRGLFAGRPEPVFEVGDGWLWLLDCTLGGMWYLLEPAARAQTRITHIHAIAGELVLRANYPADCNVDRLLADMRQASADLCVCCGRYAVAWGPLPLCRTCINASA